MPGPARTGGDRGPELGDHLLLAGQPAKDIRYGNTRHSNTRHGHVRPARRCLATGHSRIAGMLPVISSAVSGTGSGSISLTRSWMARLSSLAGRVASSTR